MTTVRIEPGEGSSTRGTKVFLDGLEIEAVTSIHLTAEVNDVWRCTLEFITDVEGFQVETTGIANQARTYRKASRWELMKALFRPMSRG